MCFGEPEEEIDTLLRVTSKLPPELATELMETGAATPPFNGAPVPFVDVFRRTGGRDRHAPAGDEQTAAGAGNRAHGDRSGDTAVQRGPGAIRRCVSAN